MLYICISRRHLIEFLIDVFWENLVTEVYVENYWIGLALSCQIELFLWKSGTVGLESVLFSLGVSRESVLGPLLFTLYVSDLSFIIQSNHVFYADDCKIFIRSFEDHSNLQSRTIWRLSRVGVTNGSYLEIQIMRHFAYWSPLNTHIALEVSKSLQKKVMT